MFREPIVKSLSSLEVRHVALNAGFATRAFRPRVRDLRDGDPYEHSNNETHERSMGDACSTDHVASVPP